MSRKDRLISRMLMAFFIAIFGPVLLLSWKDWHQMIRIGKRTSALVDSALNMIRYSPTPFMLFTPTSDSDLPPTASSTPTFILTATKTLLAAFTPSSTYSPFGSGTPNDRSRSSQTLTLFPTSTSTVVPSRTATTAPSRTPKPARSDTPTSIPTLRPSNTPRPIPPTPRPTDVPPTEITTQPPSYGVSTDQTNAN
jgi:hypothetical protein